MSFSDQAKAILSASTASVLLPVHTEIPFVEAISKDEDISLQDIEQRQILFYDECLTVYVVLHIPQCSEEELESYLSHLDLKVEVWAVEQPENIRSPATGTSTARSLVSSEKIERNDDPTVLVSLSESDDQIYLNLLWELRVQLRRPQFRLHDVFVEFIPVAVIRPLETVIQSEDYLEAFKPQVENLFEPLNSSRGYGSQVPYLPVSRLDSVLLSLPKDDHTFHIRSVNSGPIPIHLAFATRLRYSMPSINGTKQALIASLDVEVIPFVHVKGLIETAQMVLQRGTVSPLTENLLPMDCKTKDCITFLYRLENGGSPDISFQNGQIAEIDVLEVHIKLQLEISGTCKPNVEMLWTTNVDFAQLVANSSDPSTSVSKRMEATPSLSHDARSPNPSQLVGASLQQLTLSGASNGVIISFATTDSPSKVGVPFFWQVLIVNKGSKPAKLAIIPLPRVQKPTTQAQQYARRHATRSSVNSLHLSERHLNQQADVAQAVVDENVIYAMQHSGAVPQETDLMSLTPELRVGPLGPGQCHEGELKLIAFKAGAFTLDAIRVVDLAKEIEQGHGGPSVVMDIRDLPDVIIED